MRAKNEAERSALRKLSLARVTLCFAQSTLLLLGNASYALAASTFTSAEMTRIENSERSVFGSSHNNLSSESRLRALETNLFGDVKKGSIDSRLDAVEKALQIDHTKYLAAPQAAQLDHEELKEAPLAVAPDYNEEPKSPANDLIQQAMQQYSSGDATSAERTFKRALSIDKNNPDAYFNLGVLYEGKGDLQQALENYSKAQALNPSDKELRDTVQSLRTKIAQDRSSKIAEERRVQQEQQASQRRDNLRNMVTDASSDYKNGNYSEAARKLEKVASDAPNDPDVQYALGQAYRAKGDNDKARMALSRAASIDPRNSLYKNALKDLGNNLASAPRSAPSSPAPAPSYDDSRAYDPHTAYDPTPPGEITPFSNSGAPMESFGSSSRGYNGGITASFHSNRLKRAVAAGAIGAAAGALMNSRSPYRGALKSGMLKGAILGGMLGYFSGP